MTTKTQDLIKVFDLLPESEQNLTFELVKRIVLAWDSDYSKLTPAERARLEESDKDLVHAETSKYDDMDWS